MHIKFERNKMLEKCFVSIFFAVIIFQNSLFSFKQSDVDKLKAGSKECKSCDLSGKNFTKISFSGPTPFNFTQANFEGANLTQADLRGSIFTEARMIDTKLKQALLSE